MSFNNPYMRVLAGIVAIAAALRLSWLLIRPVLPALAVAALLWVVWLAVRWYRDRW